MDEKAAWHQGPATCHRFWIFMIIEGVEKVEMGDVGEREREREKGELEV
jgi:hypothetical protein